MEFSIGLSVLSNYPATGLSVSPSTSCHGKHNIGIETLSTSKFSVQIQVRKSFGIAVRMPWQIPNTLKSLEIRHLRQPCNLQVLIQKLPGRIRVFPTRYMIGALDSLDLVNWYLQSVNLSKVTCCGLTGR